MKSLKNTVFLVLAGLAAYGVYKQVNLMNREENYINECKKQILEKGYLVKDSWCFNLPENNYLEYTFTDLSERDYTVVFSKIQNTITSFREV